MDTTFINDLNVFDTRNASGDSYVQIIVFAKCKWTLTLSSQILLDRYSSLSSTSIGPHEHSNNSYYHMFTLLVWLIFIISTVGFIFFFNCSFMPIPSYVQVSFSADSLLQKCHVPFLVTAPQYILYCKRFIVKISLLWNHLVAVLPHKDSTTFLFTFAGLQPFHSVNHSLPPVTMLFSSDWWLVCLHKGTNNPLWFGADPDKSAEDGGALCSLHFFF